MIFRSFFFINHNVSPALEPFTHVPYRSDSFPLIFFLQAKEKETRTKIIDTAIVDRIFILQMTTQTNSTLHWPLADGKTKAPVLPGASYSPSLRWHYPDQVLWV